MRRLLIFILSCLSLVGQSWVNQTISTPPGGISYGGTEYNRWRQSVTGFWNGLNQNSGNIYATELGDLSYSGLSYTSRNFNGDTSVTGPYVSDSGTTEPGTGHPGHNLVYDWRHDMGVLHNRLCCSAHRNAVWTFFDTKDSASITAWTKNIATDAPNTTDNPDLSDNYSVYDPVNHWVFQFAGLQSAGLVSTIALTYDYSTNTLAKVTAMQYSSTMPAEYSGGMAEVGIFFDYKYSDNNPGEARYIFYGGYNSVGVTCATGTYFLYPNGSALQSLAAWSWQAATITGTGPASNSHSDPWGCQSTGGASNTGWALTYDTARDIVWTYKDSSHISGLSCSGTTNACTWTDYAVTNATSLTAFPYNSASISYDAAHDQLVLVITNSGPAFKTLTLDLQTVIAHSQTCGSGYPTSATAFRVTRPIAYPALNTQYTDPLGGCVTRITNVTDGSSGSASYETPTYSQVKPTDSSETLLATASGHVLDITNNNQDLGIDLNTTIRSTNFIWARTIPKTLIGMDANTTALVKKWTITTSGSGGSETGTIGAGTTLWDGTSEYQTCAGTGTPNLGLGSTMNQVSNQDRDQNDHYMALTCQKISPNYQIVLIVIDLQAGTHGVEYLITQSPRLSACTAGNPTVCTAEASITNASELVGLTINVHDAAGGSWAGLNGSQVVSAASGASVTFTFNSTGFGTYTANSAREDLPVIAVTGGCHPLFGPNFAYAGYLANYLIVEWGRTNTGNNRQCGVETFNLANAANPTGSWTFTGQISPDSTHYDLAVWGGQEYLVGLAVGSGWDTLISSIAACQLPDGFSQASHAGCSKKLNIARGGHVTAHNYTSATNFFLYDDDCSDPDINWYMGCGEIVKVYADSTPSVPHIQRLAHSYTDTYFFSNGYCSSGCQANSYWSQAKTTLNLDGTKAWYASSWGPGDGVNTYQLSVPGGGSSPSINTSVPSSNVLQQSGRLTH